MNANKLNSRSIQAAIVNARKDTDALREAGKAGSDVKLKPVKLVDGEGLRLEIKGGSYRWVFAFMWEGKQFEQPLGSFPKVSLAEARTVRGVLRDAKDRGIDPRHAYQEHTGKQQAPTAPPAPIVTLRHEMHAHIVHREGRVKDSSNREMIGLLERDAKTLLDMEPAAITQAHVLAVVKPLWETRRRSAEKVIAYGRMIWRFSQGADKPNPFGAKPRDLFGKDMLRPGGDPDVTPRPAMPWAELPQFMVALRARDEIEARALELLLLTLTPRTAEVMKAKWEQIDFPKAQWHIPADNLKGWEARTIPLSEQAVDLLLGIKPIGAQPHEWVFPSRIQCASGRLGDDAMQVLLRKTMGKSYTVHGFRSSMMDWCADTHPMLLMAAERALDHRIGGKVMQAYLRTGMIDNRRGLADLWATHLNTAK